MPSRPGTQSEYPDKVRQIHANSQPAQNLADAHANYQAVMARNPGYGNLRAKADAYAETKRAAWVARGKSNSSADYATGKAYHPPFKG